MLSKFFCWNRLHGLATLILMGAALYFIFVEHGNHILPYLPFMIILLCPLMHLFMHKNHHQHQDSDKVNSKMNEAHDLDLNDHHNKD